MLLGALLLHNTAAHSQQPSDTTLLPADTALQTGNSLLSIPIEQLRKLTRHINNIDTFYIEPQHYDFTIMLQTTATYEMYRLRSKSGQTLVFAPKASFKAGPYFGWRWIFLGYTLDFTRVHNDIKKEYNLSLYSSKIGIDLFYRKTGDDYILRRAEIGDEGHAKILRNVAFNGLKVDLKGFNAYYIFNHRRFSYPAAFSQSTVQKRSAGSLLAGVGYTRHTLNLNYERLQTLIDERMGQNSEKLDSGLMFNKVRYTDLSASIGYAYNYVPARHWLLAASLSAALGYHYSTGNLEQMRQNIRDFSFHNFNIDGLGRFAIVYNNSRIYAGSSIILHTYNYHKSQFETNNIFGSLNIYVGYNFGLKKQYRK